jgi:hypothetical protein
MHLFHMEEFKIKTNFLLRNGVSVAEITQGNGHISQVIEISFCYKVVTTFFFSGNVKSSKTNRQVVRVGSSIKILKSKECQKYEMLVAPLFERYRDKFLYFVEKEMLPKPLVLGFSLINSTNVRADFPNKIQTIYDLLVKHGWIPDDNMKEIKLVELPHFTLPCKTVKNPCIFCGAEIVKTDNECCPACGKKLLPGFHLFLLKPI